MESAASGSRSACRSWKASQDSPESARCRSPSRRDASRNPFASDRRGTCPPTAELSQTVPTAPSRKYRRRNGYHPSSAVKTAPRRNPPAAAVRRRKPSRRRPNAHKTPCPPAPPPPRPPPAAPYHTILKRHGGTPSRNGRRRRIFRGRHGGRRRRRHGRHAGRPPRSRRIGRICGRETPVQASSRGSPDCGTNGSATDSPSEKPSSGCPVRHAPQSVLYRPICLSLSCLVLFLKNSHVFSL